MNHCGQWWWNVVESGSHMATTELLDAGGHYSNNSNGEFCLDFANKNSLSAWLAQHSNTFKHVQRVFRFFWELLDIELNRVYFTEPKPNLNWTSHSVLMFSVRIEVLNWTLATLHLGILLCTFFSSSSNGQVITNSSVTWFEYIKNWAFTASNSLETPSATWVKALDSI